MDDNNFDMELHFYMIVAIAFHLQDFVPKRFREHNAHPVLPTSCLGVYKLVAILNFFIFVLRQLPPLG